MVVKKATLQNEQNSQQKRQGFLSRKHKFFVTTEADTRYSQMLKNIQQAKTDLDCAYLNFEHATDPDLIDCYIYQLKSAQMRYKFLLDSIKQAEACREHKHC